MSMDAGSSHAGGAARRRRGGWGGFRWECGECDGGEAMGDCCERGTGTRGRTDLLQYLARGRAGLAEDSRAPPRWLSYSGADSVAAKWDRGM